VTIGALTAFGPTPSKLKLQTLETGLEPKEVCMTDSRDDREQHEPSREDIAARESQPPEPPATTADDTPEEADEKGD
jgi:hypothetical protein